jgi:hypothetical protein
MISKNKCVCDGEGTIYGENTGLRREIFRLKKENELLKSETIEKLMKILQKE